MWGMPIDHEYKATDLIFMWGMPIDHEYKAIDRMHSQYMHGACKHAKSIE